MYGNETAAIIQLVADAYTRQSGELAELNLTAQERFDRALAQVAADADVPEEELRAAINLFVAAVEIDADARGLRSRFGCVREAGFHRGCRCCG